MKKVLSLFFVLMCSCFTTANAFFGFNKKAVDPKPIEYYILGDDLARQFDVVNSPSFHVSSDGRPYINKPEDDNYYRRLGTSKSFFRSKYIYEDDIFLPKTETNGRITIRNRASRGIVNIFENDFNDDDMAEAKVFVPSVRNGELSARDFKKQLRIGNVVNKGLIRTEKKARMIEPKMDEFNFICTQKYNSCIVSFVLNIVKRFSSPEMLNRIEIWSISGRWDSEKEKPSEYYAETSWKSGVITYSDGVNSYNSDYEGKDKKLGTWFF